MKTLPLLIELSSTDFRQLVAEKLLNIMPKPLERILIINPPQISEADFLLERALNSRYWSYQPYGPGVLCRNLKNRGYETDILDLNFEILHKAREDKDKFFYKVWKEILLAKLLGFKPQVVGISCMFTMTHSIMKEISDYVKKNFNLPVVAGGVHLSNATKLVLEDCSSIDFIGLYECDHSFPDMLDFVNGKLDQNHLYQLATIINGYYVDIRERVVPEEASIQVTPLYHDLPISLYDEIGQIGTYGFMRKGRKAASLLRARGCRAKCSFCSVRVFNGPGVRERNYLNVVDEIEHLINQYGIKHLTFLDDDLLSDRKDIMALFNEIAKRKLDITWDASNGLIAAAITPEIMEAMVASGCIGFNLGIESGNSQILRDVHKPGTVDSFRKCKEIVDKYPNVFVKGFLMIGFPNETLRMMMDTLKLGLELSLDWYAIQILNPLPSTEIYGVMMEQGLIQDGLETSNVAFVFGPHGRQKLREEREKIKAEDFFDLFNACKPEEVPANNTLGDYWFLMDYKLNYEKLLNITQVAKLSKIEMTLEDICLRIASDSPMAYLFWGIVNQRLGNLDKAKKSLPVMDGLLSSSDYWRKRFSALELYSLRDKLVHDLSM